MADDLVSSSDYLGREHVLEKVVFIQSLFRRCIQQRKIRWAKQLYEDIVQEIEGDESRYQLSWRLCAGIPKPLHVHKESQHNLILESLAQNKPKVKAFSEQESPSSVSAPASSGSESGRLSEHSSCSNETYSVEQHNSTIDSVEQHNSMIDSVEQHNSRTDLVEQHNSRTDLVEQHNSTTDPDVCISKHSSGIDLNKAVIDKSPLSNKVFNAPQSNEVCNAGVRQASVACAGRSRKDEGEVEDVHFAEIDANTCGDGDDACQTDATSYKNDQETEFRVNLVDGSDLPPMEVKGRSASETVQNEQIRSASETVQDEQIRSTSETVQDEQIRSASEKVHNEQIRSTSEMVQNEQIRSASEMVQDEQIRSASEMVQDEQIRSASETVHDEQIRSTSEMVQDEQIVIYENCDDMLFEDRLTHVCFSSGPTKDTLGIRDKEDAFIQVDPGNNWQDTGADDKNEKKIPLTSSKLDSEIDESSRKNLGNEEIEQEKKVSGENNLRFLQLFSGGQKGRDFESSFTEGKDDYSHVGGREMRELSHLDVSKSKNRIEQIKSGKNISGIKKNLSCLVQIGHLTGKRDGHPGVKLDSHLLSKHQKGSEAVIHVSPGDMQANNVPCKKDLQIQSAQEGDKDNLSHVFIPPSPILNPKITSHQSKLINQKRSKMDHQQYSNEMSNRIKAESLDITNMTSVAGSVNFDLTNVTSVAGSVNFDHTNVTCVAGSGNFAETSVWSVADSSLSESYATVEQLQELRRNVALELLWVEQAIQSRKSYLKLRRSADEAGDLIGK